MNIIPERFIVGKDDQQILNIFKKQINHRRQDIIPELSDDDSSDDTEPSPEIEINLTKINKINHCSKDILPVSSDDDGHDDNNNNDTDSQDYIKLSSSSSTPLLETYFITIRNQNTNIPFTRLKHIKWDTKFIKNVSNHGPYSEENHNDNNNLLYKQLNNWLNKGISKEINVCTVTKLDFSPIIKTGKRYNSKLNRNKINLILNYNKKKKIIFNPYQFTYGIKFSGTSMGSRHNACISAMYTDDNYFDLQQYKNPNNIATSKLRVNHFDFHNDSSQNPSSILQIISQQNNINSTYLFGYYLDHNLDLLSVSSFKYANIFFQIRLRDANKKSGHLLEFRLILDRFLFRGMRNYIKLTLFIMTLEVYKCFSNYSFSLHCWQGYYESFRRYIKSKHEIKYKYINSDGKSENFVSDVSGDKYELYILIDPFQIESRVKTYLNSKHVDLNDHELYPRENISHQDGEEDIFIQYPINVEIWIITSLQENEELLRIICSNKIQAYFEMIKNKASGVSEWSQSDNRIKHFNGYIYKYATGMTEQEVKHDECLGLRKQRYNETPLFYKIEHENLNCLDEETDFDMNACNLYHGIKKSNIGQHKEDYKFKGKIWSKITGESSFLTIGGINRGWTNFIVTIFTQNGCYIGYESQGFCMTIAGHGLKPPHLLWKKYVYRLCDLYRFVKDNLAKNCSDHFLDCECWESSNFDNVCNCIKSKSLMKHSDLPSFNELLPHLKL